MSTIAAPLTVEQFLALPEDERVRQELIGGEIIAMGRGGQPHEIVKSNFSIELGAFFKHNPIGRVMSETTFQLTDHDSPMPDVSVVLAGRLQEGRTGLIQLSPDIAIEVVSSEPAAVLQAKIKLYLQHGTKVVWVAYPELRIIHVYDGKGVRELAGTELLEAPEILPGFSVPVAAFFAGA
jgi:Uma2 family endonuclease